MGGDKRDPVSGQFIKEDVLKRFVKFIDVQPNGCMYWTGQLCCGYGHFRSDKVVKAHRFIYEWVYGPIPEGKQLAHRCHVRRCVNPDHVRPLTPRENSLEGNTTAAINHRKTHCPAGHPYDEENTVVYNNKRHCRTCKRQKDSCRSELRKQQRRKEKPMPCNAVSTVSMSVGNEITKKFTSLNQVELLLPDELEMQLGLKMVAPPMVDGDYCVRFTTQDYSIVVMADFRVYVSARSRSKSYKEVTAISEGVEDVLTQVMNMCYFTAMAEVAKQEGPTAVTHMDLRRGELVLEVRQS